MKITNKSRGEDRYYYRPCASQSSITSPSEVFPFLNSSALYLVMTALLLNQTPLFAFAQGHRLVRLGDTRNMAAVSARERPLELLASGSNRTAYFAPKEGDEANEGEEEDERQDEEEDDDEEDFYNKNPVGKLDFVVSEREPRRAASSEIELFDDFDDYEALDLASFYKPVMKQSSSKGRKSLQISKAKLNPRKPRIKVKPGNKRSQKEDKTSVNVKQTVNRYQPSGSRAVSNRLVPVLAGAGGVVANQCAIQLQSGACITYAHVELAIRQAKQLLGFQGEGDGLNSLEPAESLVGILGELNEYTSRLLAHQFQLTSDEINFGLEQQVDVSRTSLWRSCPRIYRVPLARSCESSLRESLPPNGGAGAGGPLQWRRYRSYTGQCNNLLQPQLGASLMPFARFLPPDYSDGVGAPRRSSLANQELPPARVVSLNLHPDLEAPSSDLSTMFVNWGQLINHDLALASGARTATGHDGNCCKLAMGPTGGGGAGAPSLRSPLARVCMPIQIGLDDPHYARHAIRCHEFKRSIAALRPGCSLGPRTQLNSISSFVDGSFVYGSSGTASAVLRSGADGAGQMRTRNYFNRSLNLKPLLPPQVDQPDEECRGRRAAGASRYCFLSGDSRTNQQIQLVALHTIHTRQHNRLAQGLRLANPHWSAARLFEEARHIHIALIQHILLSEYLPLLLGEKVMSEHSLRESDLNEYWDHYEATLNPGVSQEFAAAAFRQGHSSVPNVVFRVGPTGAARAYLLRQVFRQPWALYEPGAMDEFLRGLLEVAAQSVDPFVAGELTSHLLQEPNEQVGMDLVAINIQRGRDQGVASYNAVRQWCGLKPFENFHQLDAVMSNLSSQLMGELYESVDDIDLYSGGLSEYPLTGAQVGPTFACVIGRQFFNLRAGDRYWFESSGGPHAFTMDQLNSIKQVTLARLVCANSDSIGAIQPLAMRLPHPVLNPTQPCAALPDVELALWMEPRPQIGVDEFNED